MTGSWLGRVAAGAPAQVFPLVGRGARRHVRDLLGRDEIDLVASPRHATVLLMAGQIPVAWDGFTDRVHDQLPHPRIVVHAPWDPGDLVEDLVAAHHAVMTGTTASTPPRGPATAPVDWKGVGPHGQGGEGMMGGTPYGRPMAMTGEDLRDGLQLDLVGVRIGPFLAWWWPPGLLLDLRFQGDLIVKAEVADARPFAQTLDDAKHMGGTTPPTPAEIVTDTLGAVGHQSLAQRWLACAGPAQRSGLAGRIRRSVAGFSPGTGRSDVDGRDLRQRMTEWVRLATIDTPTSPSTPLDDPPPLSGAAAVGHLPVLLAGLTWREAAVTIASLGLDLSEPGPGTAPDVDDAVSATALEAPG